MSRSDTDHIENAKAHLVRLRQHLARGDLDDETVFDAVCMRLSAAIESVSSIDEQARDREFGGTWPAIWSVRNRIAHGYIYADRSIINATVANDLNGFEQSLDRLAEIVQANDSPDID